jgi:hypothetical protein
MKKLLLIIALLVAISSNAFAATKYISVNGAGALDGSSLANAYAWAAGTAFATAQTALSNGDTIEFDCGRYVGANLTVSKQLTIQGCSTYNADGVTGTVIVGNRELPIFFYGTGASNASGNADTGYFLFTLGANVDNVTIQKMTILRVQYAVYALNYNNDNITIQDLYIKDVRSAIWIYGDAGCVTTPNVYTCPAGASGWIIQRIKGKNASKRFIRIERGAHDGTITDVRFDGGLVGNGDFGIGIEFGTSGAAAAPVYNWTVTRAQISGFFESTSTSYDNGDCVTSEAYASNITLTDVSCLDTWDGGFDMKGGPITCTGCTSFRDGNRPFRFWNGPITVTNSIAGYTVASLDSTDSNYEQITQYADGSNSCFWISGVVTVDHFTCINTERPYRFDDTGNNSLTYNLGSGSAATPGNVVTGSISGTKAKIAGVTGNATSGTLLIFNGGTFTIGDTLTDGSGFSATATSVGTAFIGGKLTISDSLIAQTSAYTSYSTAEADDSGGTRVLSETNVKIWQQGVSGVDPVFADALNRNWYGCNNDFDSATYLGTLGYYNNASANTCLDSDGVEEAIASTVAGTTKKYVGSHGTFN